MRPSRYTAEDHPDAGDLRKAADAWSKLEAAMAAQIEAARRKERVCLVQARLRKAPDLVQAGRDFCLEVPLMEVGDDLEMEGAQSLLSVLRAPAVDKRLPTAHTLRPRWPCPSTEQLSSGPGPNGWLPARMPLSPCRQ